MLNYNNKHSQSSKSSTEENKSATKSNAIEIPSISLPKGGGAIKSIDEKFSVNAVNGTASFSIPFPVSDARGFSPALGISYSSGAGSGVFGLGWSMSIPSIKRKTDKKLPEYLDGIDSDIFLLSEAEDLVPEFKKDDSGNFIKDSDGNYSVNEFERNFFGSEYIVKTYRPRIEGLFSRIERWTEKSTFYVHWRVISKNNTTSIFGKSKESRIADPDDDRRIFEWLLEFSFDDKGNCYYYGYKQENELGFDTSYSHNKNRKGNGIKYANTYLKRVLYGIRKPYKNKGESYSKNSADYFFETIFDYGEHDTVTPPFAEIKEWDFRSDAFSTYRTGFEIRTTRLCKRVLLYHRFSELPDGSALVKSLDFVYDNNGVDMFTFLKDVISKGYIKAPNGTYTQKSLPPISFEYQKHEWNTEVKSLTSESLVHSPSGIDENNYHFVDLFSEGLSGILTEQGNQWYYKSNLGAGNFTQAKLLSQKPSFNGYDQHVQLMELEADGIKQLVNLKNEPKGFFELNPDGEWQPFKQFEDNLNINHQNRNMRMLDLDGDGITDLLITDQNGFIWYASNGKKGYKPSRIVYNSFDEEKAPQIIFSDGTQCMFLADMSGDGLTDITRIRNGEVCYWPNLGYGKFGAKITMDNSPVFDHPENFNTSLVKLADIDGSGTADIIYLGKNKFSIYFNQQGNSFSDPKIIEPFPEINTSLRIDTADLLGTGLSCIVWNSPSPKHESNPLRYINLTNNKKPHILVSYKNNLGKELSIDYSPSTEFYINDKISGKPWITKLHFAVHCVSKTETKDTVTGTRFTSSYKYHHGYYDHSEREFRGFGMVEQTDTEEFEHWVKGSSSNIVESNLHQAPVLTKTWYHTGAYLNREKTLTQFSHEYWYEEMKRAGFEVTQNEVSLPEASLYAAPGLDSSVIEDMSADDWREALRSCKGMALRTEIFAIDAPVEGADQGQIKKQLSPFTVASQNCVIQLIQPREKNKNSVFIVKESESITYNYERNTNDPVISHTLNIKFDSYGNVLESASVVYPRLMADSSLPLQTQEVQGKTHIKYLQNIYTNDILEIDVNRHRLISETKTYELKGVNKNGAIYSTADFTNILNNSAEVPYHETTAEPLPGASQKRLIEHLRTIYLKNDLTGALDLHKLESKAITFENYQLAYTPELLENIFGSKVDNSMMMEGKFTHSEGDNNWWIRSGTVQYIESGETVSDAENHFYMPVSYTDPYGAKTKVKYYSDYFLIIEETEDALQNRVKTLSFDMRNIICQRMIGINDNISEVLIDELGLVKAIAFYGKGNDADDLTGIDEFTSQSEENLINNFLNESISTNVTALGKDLLKHSSIRFIYDLNRYKNSGGKEPTSAVSIAREEHFIKNNDSPVQLSFEYSNGYGKVILKKVQAEPGAAKKVIVNPDGSYTVSEEDTSMQNPKQLRWTGNGRTIVNNKGKTVKQYEPYFSVTHKFENFKELVETGVSPVMYYDAVGRHIKTDFPDGTFSKTEFNPWKEIVYDQNDTVLESSWYNDRINNLIDSKLIAEGKSPLKEKEAALRTAKHSYTPSIKHFDALQRPILIIEHNKKTDNSDLFLHTRFEFDIEGNECKVVDPKGNPVMEYKYDMLGDKVYQTSMDSGKRWMLGNILRNPIRTWDERSHEVVYEYDILHRPTIKTIKGGDENIPLNNIYEKVIYGENLPNDKTRNLRAKAAVIYDTAGKVELSEFDFNDNPTKILRTFAKKYKEVVNWDLPDPDTDLEPETFISESEYDALSRITKQSFPDSSIFNPEYNEAGMLNSVMITQNGNPEWFIKNIDYNEKSQRKSILYGNEVKTGYSYDNETFELLNIKTTNANNELLQDLYYTYDPSNNVTHIEDKAIPTVFFNNQKITGTSNYKYDALYRLIEAEGREHIGQVSFGEQDNFDDNWCKLSLQINSPMQMRTYTQKYNYDEAGNILGIQHTAQAGSWTRSYNYESSNNRLVSSTVGADTYNFTHHPNHGFMTSLPHLQVMKWNFKDELQASAQQKVINGVPETTYYVYDNNGQRVRKITENSAGSGVTPSKKEERMYIEGVEIFRVYSGNNTGLERKTLHVLDNTKTVAMIETRNDVDDGTEKRMVRYQFSNNIGSASLETDDSGNVISYEEHHPFGTTSYMAVDKAVKMANKRYRFTGKERDEETNLYYCGTRYYLCWLARWSAPDSAGLADGLNLYAYIKNNPLHLVDPNGTQGLDPKHEQDLIKWADGLKENTREKSLRLLFDRLKKLGSYSGLDADAKKDLDKMIDLAVTRKNPIYYYSKLHLALNSPEGKGGGSYDWTPDFNKAHKDAKKRLSTKEGLLHLKDEEKRTKEAERKGTFVKVKGFDNKEYRVDRSDPKNIHIHLKVRVVGRWEKDNNGKDVFRWTNPDDALKLRWMEDDIEKLAASTKGYTVDLEFVFNQGPDVFEIDVDPKHHPYTTIWSGHLHALVHEMHHLFMLEDRYNYIESAPSADYMTYKERLWRMRMHMEKLPRDVTQKSLMSGEGGGSQLLQWEVCQAAFPDSQPLRENCEKVR